MLGRDKFTGKKQNLYKFELTNTFLLIIAVFKAQTFVEGSNVTLKCDSTEIKWNELIYIIWNISLQSRKCWIGLSKYPNITIQNFCNDGKMLLNSSDGFSVFIPNISKKDEGSYLCEASYKGGGYRQNANISGKYVIVKTEKKNIFY